MLRFNHQQPDFQSFRSPVHHAFNNAQNTSLSIHNSSLGRRSRITCSNPGQIYDLIIEKKIEKAIEKRNKIYDNEKKSDLLLIDLCDCLLFNTPEYKAYNPQKSYEIFNKSLLPNSKERTLIKFLDKKDNSLDSIRTQIEQSLYKLACRENTEESYARFIDLCPQSKWVEPAAQKQEDIAYRQAIEKGTIEGYNYFLSHYASSEHVVEITRLADKTTFAQLDNTIEAYKNSSNYIRNRHLSKRHKAGYIALPMPKLVKPIHEKHTNNCSRNTPITR